ncbi:MAG TPA: class I SAM-dependent methyltransferase [Acidimicrobiales bacterium]|nr:class I SAM-dependent methyltransferase [Acidimicrobiales bacterium]
MEPLSDATSDEPFDDGPGWVPEEITAHYEREYDEGNRIVEGLGQLELLRTREILARHLPPAPLRILDIGGGTGVHAQWLAQQGHDVLVIDPIARHVAQASDLASSGLPISAELGDARSLPVGDATFDAALLLGPLYHLTTREDRLLALREAGRAVRSGGWIFVAAISRFASLFDGLTGGMLSDPAFLAIVKRDLRDGQHRNPERRPGWFTTAFFHRPDELLAEAAAAGYSVVELVGLEGLACWLPQLEASFDNPREREAILLAARSIETEPSLLGLSAHLLLVARCGSSEKPSS